MKLIFFRKLFIGLLFGAIASAILLLVFTFLLSKQEDPNALMSVFSVVSLLVGALVCGKVATLGLERRALQGLAAGVLFTLAVLLPSVLLSNFDSFSLLKMLASVVLAFTGAMLGAKRGESTSSAKRRKNVMKRYAR